MIDNLFILAAALIAVIKGATMATKHAARLAESYRLSEYVVGFIIISIISVLPETFVAINSIVKGIPSFGLGVLFGASVADLTLIFAVIILLAGRGLKVESKTLKNHAAYSFLLLLPLALGLDGHFSRPEGAALIIAGAVFYYATFRSRAIGASATAVLSDGDSKLKSSLMLILSMAILLVGAHFTVISATSLAGLIGVNHILIGMIVVGLGTTMPEFFFALKAVKKHDDSLAVGNIFGTVLANATIVVGILALISPFSFPQKIIYITGAFMVVASFLLFHFMRSGRTVTKKEAYMLIAFWLVFALVEFIASN